MAHHGLYTMNSESRVLAIHVYNLNFFPQVILLS